MICNNCKGTTFDYSVQGSFSVRVTADDNPSLPIFEIDMDKPRYLVCQDCGSKMYVNVPLAPDKLVSLDNKFLNNYGFEGRLRDIKRNKTI